VTEKTTGIQVEKPVFGSTGQVKTCSDILAGGFKAVEGLHGFVRWLGQEPDPSRLQALKKTRGDLHPGRAPCPDHHDLRSCIQYFPEIRRVKNPGPKDPALFCPWKGLTGSYVERGSNGELE
jgi:hypothetical protein